MSEGEQLRNVRARLRALPPGQWLIAAKGDLTMVEAKTDDGELLEIMTFHRGASPAEIDFVTHSYADMRFILALLDRAIERIKAMSPPPPKADEPARAKPNFAAEASMKCAEPAFKVFLEERHGLERPLTDDRVAHKLRSLLRISSRAELNDNDEAAKRWRDLRAAYEAWRKESR